MATAHDEVRAAGGAAVGIGTAAAYQARGLLKRGHPFPLWLDPERRVYDALGLGRLSLARFLFDARGWGRYLRSLAAVRRQGLITAHYSVLSGVALTDAAGEVRYVHRATGLGDYPPVDELIGRLRELA